jgi:hypothetical protein
MTDTLSTEQAARRARVADRTIRHWLKLLEAGPPALPEHDPADPADDPAPPDGLWARLGRWWKGERNA